MLTFCSCYVLLFVTIIVALDNSLVTAGFTSFQSTKSSKTTLSLSLNDWSRSTTKTMCSRESFLSSCSKKGTAFLSIIGIVAAIEPTDQCSAVEWNFIKNTRNRSNNGNSNNNPRYIEKELQMEYGTDGDGNPRSRGVLVRRYTGDSTPYEFPIKPIQLIKEWPPTIPFMADDFRRADPTNDGIFYTIPKLVYHIDEPAVASLTQYYRKTIQPGSTILDICSSWVSHYPLEFPQTMKKICATGINPIELKFNDQLTGGYIAQDLNIEPKLQYANETFDVVTCVVSIDYLIQPIEVLKEVHRVLKPGGKVIISQSNRCFPTKAIAMWLQMNDRQHLELINGYFQYAGGYEIPCKAYDITATIPDGSYRDPMFIVEATKI